MVSQCSKLISTERTIQINSLEQVDEIISISFDDIISQFDYKQYLSSDFNINDDMKKIQKIISVYFKLKETRI